MGDLGSLRSRTFKFDYALWVCMTMFAEVKHKNVIKGIHILTNCDDPSGPLQLPRALNRVLRDCLRVR